MCLVKSEIHKKDFSKPFIAEKDIIVYKTLDHRNSFTGEKRLCTPYRYHPISFTDGKCVMAGNLECENEIGVNIGFHSYVNEGKAKISCKAFTETKMTKHWSIIPKGSKYFLGKHEDIVSNNLIIFKTRGDFRKYRRNQK